MSKLEEILDLVTREYQKKSYSELRGYVDKVQCFERQYMGRVYDFEVHAMVDKHDKIKVMIESSRSPFPLNFLGKVRYFSVSTDGRVDCGSGEAF